MSRTLGILLHPLPCLVRGEVTLQVEQVAVGESVKHRVVSLVDVLSIKVEVGEVWSLHPFFTIGYISRSCHAPEMLDRFC